jgi:hypothetical protein
MSTSAGSNPTWLHVAERRKFDSESLDARSTASDALTLVSENPVAASGRVDRTPELIPVNPAQAVAVGAVTQGQRRISIRPFSFSEHPYHRPSSVSLISRSLPSLRSKYARFRIRLRNRPMSHVKVPRLTTGLTLRVA